MECPAGKCDISDMNKDDVQNIRDAIVMAALPNVEFDGWNWPMIENSAQEAGYDAAMARAVFPDRIKDVLDGFADLADREMLKALGEINPEDLRVRDRIGTALLARFEWLAAHKDALRQSVQFWIVPSRKPRGAKVIWRTADRIWAWSQADSANFSRFSKRGLLSGIIVSTTFAFLNDDQENMDNTKAFLDRRIENVMQLGKVIRKVKTAS